MTPRIRTSSAIHLLATLPHQLGYTPRDSLVLVPLNHRETRGVLRIDLPADGDVEQVAATAVGYACRVPDVEDLIVVVYTDGPVRDGAGVAHEALVSIIGERADACGLRVTGELCVGSDGWASYDAAAARPLSELDDADPGGSPVQASQTAGVDVGTDDEAASRVAPRVQVLSRMPIDAFRRIGDTHPPGTGESGLDAELAAFDRDPHELFERMLAGGDLPADRAAVWIWILCCPALRDVVLTQWSGGADEARRTLAWQADWLRGDTATPDFPMRIAGEGSRPERGRLIAARDVARVLASQARKTDRAACLAVCGWLSWALGNATHAAEYTRQALDLHESFSFAHLLARMTDQGMIPGWSYDPAGVPLTPPWMFAEPAVL